MNTTRISVDHFRLATSKSHVPDCGDEGVEQARIVAVAGNAAQFGRSLALLWPVFLFFGSSSTFLVGSSP
jgi:hypothetical protein